MPSPTNTSPSALVTRLLRGNSAYADRRDSLAAVEFAAAAEQASAAADLSTAMYARRWEGNSLLWAGDILPATRALLAVATCRDPRVDPAAIYTAMTDLIMLAQFHGSAARVQSQIAEAEAYLALVNRSGWGHRLALHRAILSCQRGDFVAAMAHARQAYEGSRRCLSGPAYSEFAMLRWWVRAAFFAADLPLVSVAINLSQRHTALRGFEAQSRRCMYLHFQRLRRRAGESCAGLREYATAALHFERSADPHDTTLEVGRALLLCGCAEGVSELSWQGMVNWPFELALFAFDLELNLQRRAERAPPIDLDLDPPPGEGAKVPHPSPRLEAAADALRVAAATEAKRLASSWPAVRASRRLAWLGENPSSAGLVARSAAPSAG